MGTPPPPESLGQRHSERCRQASDPPRHGFRWHPSSADPGRPLELRRVALSDHVVPRRFTGLERDGGNIGLHSNAKEGGRVDTAASQGQRRQGLGKKSSGKPQKKPADDKTGKTCHVRDCLNRHRLRESRIARHLKPKGKGGGKGNGQVNNVYDEQYDGDQYADSAAVSPVTRDDHWIMVLERGPQADQGDGFRRVCSHAATARGQALTSYGRCRYR